MALTQITNYQVQYSANKFPPRIWLTGGNKSIGQLIFMPDGSTLPPDSQSGTQVNVYYHLEDFQNVFRLLAEEKTAYLLFNGAGGSSENGIQTSADPLGNLP
jgi:hypothetical protein